MVVVVVVGDGDDDGKKTILWQDAC